MDYREIAEAYSEIEAASKRLEMTDLLVALLQKSPPGMIDKVVYLTQGKLAPDFSGIELGLAEKLALKAIYEGTRVDESKIMKWWMKEGDLGTVAFEAVSQKKQTSLFAEPLTVNRVYDSLMEIANASGSGSQEKKMKLFAKLLHDSAPIEAKYMARMLNGKLRLGIADMTIVDALAIAFSEKENRDIVENAYNICSDMGKVAKLLATGGLAALENIKLEVGVPLRAMLCERLSGIPEIIEKLGACAFEYKYDGLRVQAHIDGNDIRLFTRQLESVTDQFPDVVSAIGRSFRGQSCVIEGECVPVDINTGEFLPFQEVSHRRGRKTDLDNAVQDYPVVLFLFDCLYLDGEELVARPLPERRRALVDAINFTEEVRISQALITDDAEAAEAFFQQSILDGCEGIIAKSIRDDSTYRAGSRGWQWIKFKRDYKSSMDDTVDLVVIGAFAGKGRRAGNYGALLMASYNKDEDVFESVTKLGSGFNDEMLAVLPDMLAPFKTENMHPRVDSVMKPDHWFAPGIVMEVRGAEITLSPIHTCAFGSVREKTGLAIRFPRFIGPRKDKSPEDATTSAEMLELYNLQFKRSV